MRESQAKLIDILNLEYEDYVKNLSKNLKNDDFYRLINMGLEDGFLDDEKVKVDPNCFIECEELIPTQSQISLKDSLGWICRNKPNEILNFLNNNTTHYENNRILVANRRFILDGHHRWSATILINPNAEIPCVNLDFGSDLDGTDILKYIQMGIAATYGKIAKSKADESTDILHPDMWGNKLRSELGRTLGSKAIHILKDALNVEENLEVIEYVYDNVMLVKELKSEFSPSRDYMPQPSKTAKSAGRSPEQTKDFLGLPSEFIDTMSSGKLNFKSPFLKQEKFNHLKKFRDF